MWFQTEVVKGVMDGKAVGLAAVSVGLFLLNSVLQIFTKAKLESQKEAIRNVAQALSGMKDEIDEIKTISKQSYVEIHEQWGRINESARLLSENSMRLKDLSDTIDGVAQQQTILATTQLQQNQNMQKVIDGLIEVLQEQTK